MKRKVLKALGALVALCVLGFLGFVGYINVTYKRDFSSVPLPNIKASTDPKVIAYGEYVASIAHCAECHGDGAYTNKHDMPPDLKDLRGGYTLASGPFGTFYPINLTPDETGLGKRTDAELARTIRHGVSADGRLAPLMSFGVGPMADEDLTAVISFLRSLPPTKNTTKPDEWGWLAKALAGKFNPRMSIPPKYVAPGGVSKERGEYIATGPANCFFCHTPTDPARGFVEIGPRFSGSNDADPDLVDPSYEVIAPNLTPDPETGALASYDEEAFINRFRNVGAITKGSQMSWDCFKRMTDDDLKSIFAYLTSLPPTKHAVGPSRRKRS